MARLVHRFCDQDLVIISKGKAKKLSSHDWVTMRTLDALLGTACRAVKSQGERSVLRADVSIAPSDVADDIVTGV